MTSELEANIVSIERINEYIDLKPEAPWNSAPSPLLPPGGGAKSGGRASSGGVSSVLDRTPPLPADWPSRGTVEFINYSMAYKPGDDPVLKDLSFTVASREKVDLGAREERG